ncbi:hypothetical protein HK096_004019, partial [Nowakowskiella sp. JEL0078]
SLKVSQLLDIEAPLKKIKDFLDENPDGSWRNYCDYIDDAIRRLENRREATTLSRTKENVEKAITQLTMNRQSSVSNFF